MQTLKTFYKSKKWERLTERLRLERVNQQGELICEHCGKPIIKKYDCIAHHKIELNEENVNDYSISLNPDNIELIHFKCHNDLHQRFSSSIKPKVYLVYGSPCAGKSSWVNEVAARDDLILDMDRIWEAICNSDRYHKPNRLKANAFGLRDAIIDQVRTRTGMWRNAYIIGGYPLRSDRDRLCDLLRAEPVFIEASEAECLSRAKTDDWKYFIHEWFDSYTE